VNNPLITPQLNSNGTSAEELMDQLVTVHDCIRELLSAMRKARPHGRDFRTDAAFVHAHRAWEERIEAVIALNTELLEHTDALAKARDERQRQRDRQRHAAP
jgi:hypothetical protein